jgi:hypothetical protein
MNISRNVGFQPMMEEMMAIPSGKIRLFSAAVGVTAAIFASGAAFAHHDGGERHNNGGIVPVHGSPPLNGGVLVTHGNLKFSLPTETIVRDHRPGTYGCHGHHVNPGNCAPGGIIGGNPIDPPYGGLPQGGIVHDHRS